MIRIDSISNISSITSSFFVNDQVIYITSSKGLFKTTDGGASWVKKSNVFNIIFNKVYFSDPLQGWGVARDGEILHTTNGGDNWTLQTSTILNDLVDIDFSTAQPGTGLAISYFGDVIKTTDFGNTWNKLDSLSNIFWFGDIQFLKNSLTAYIVGLSGQIFKTTNAGETFIEQNSPHYTDYSSICIVSDSLAWIAGEENTIVSTSDGGNNWTVQRRTIRTGFSGSYIYDIEFANSQIGIAISEDGEGYRTTNGGSTWQHFDTGEFSDLTDLFIEIANRSNAWIVGDFNGLLRTTDAGESWTKISTSGLAISVAFSLCFRNSLDGIISGLSSTARGLIYRTTNGGGNWTQVYRDSTKRINDLWNAISSTYIAVGDSGTILRSTNSGVNWNKITSGTTETLNKLHFVTQDIGWALGTTILLKTTDRGVTWTPINIYPGIARYDIHFTSQLTGYFVGEIFQNPTRKGVIFKTTDGGITWQEQFFPLQVDRFFSVYFFGENVGWVGGENGSIYKTTTGGILDIESDKIDNIIPNLYVLHQNYPNPFNPSTKIRYSIPSSSNVTIKVYDILGNEVATLLNEQKAAGNYEASFDGANLASGIYFYRLTASSFIQVKKMNLLK